VMKNVSKNGTTVLWVLDSLANNFPFVHALVVG